MLNERRSRDRGISPQGRRFYLFRDLRGDLIVVVKSNKADYENVRRPQSCPRGKVHLA